MSSVSEPNSIRIQEGGSVFQPGKIGLGFGLEGGLAMQTISTQQVGRYEGTMQNLKGQKVGGGVRKGGGSQSSKAGGQQHQVPDGPFSEDVSSAHSGNDDDGSSSFIATSPSPSSHGSCHGEGLEDSKLLDKRVRHKKVEQNRRELTRKFTEELQELVPGAGAQGTCFNTVLEGVLQYLQQGGSGAVGKRKRSDSDEIRPEDLCLRLTMPNKVRVPRGFTQGMFGGAFESAPMGIIMASTAGQVLRCNSMFFNLFGLDQIEGTPTMFSLTAPSSVPATMQAASALISGACNNVKLVKRCLRRGGVEDEFQVQMNVVHKANKPQYFLCYVRHTKRTRPGLEEPERNDQYRKQYASLVQDAPFTQNFIPSHHSHTNEEIHDPDLDGFFRSLDPDAPGPGEGAHLEMLPDTMP